MCSKKNTDKATRSSGSTLIKLKPVHRNLSLFNFVVSPVKLSAGVSPVKLSASVSLVKLSVVVSSIDLSASASPVKLSAAAFPVKLFAAASSFDVYAIYIVCLWYLHV